MKQLELTFPQPLYRLLCTSVRSGTSWRFIGLTRTEALLIQAKQLGPCRFGPCPAACCAPGSVRVVIELEGA
jgi:hypothetical protein